MLTLMKSLHVLASARGDGLRPELLRHLPEPPVLPTPQGQNIVADVQEIEFLIEFLPMVAKR